MANSTDVCEARLPGDTAWLLSCGVLVLTMQGGFALLESGSVRVNNTVNILVKNIFDMALGGVAYWSLGWGLAYGKSLGGFVGTSDFFPDEGLDYSMWFFQLSFAATASTIDSGACCERMHLDVYFGLSFFVTMLSYPIATHWVWSEDGWLSQLGFIDLAGVSVVHALGGASALVCTLMLGPRLGVLHAPIPDELKCVAKQLELSHRVFAGEPVHVLFGSMLLFFGWVGFNSGSSLGLDQGGHLMAGHVAYTTMLGGCFGCCAGSWVGMRHRKGQLQPGDIATALLAGLVSVTGAAHVICGWQAALLGAVGSGLAVKSIPFWEKHGVDDPVGVLPVHLVAAFVGTLGSGLFAHSVSCTGVANDMETGLAYSGSLRLLGVQLLGFVTITVWSSFWTYVYLVVVEKVLGKPIRVDCLQEMVGNDVVEHGVDVFQRLKHTAAMQRIMGKLNPNRANTIVKSAVSQYSQVESDDDDDDDDVDDDDSGNDSIDGGKPTSRYAPSMIGIGTGGGTGKGGKVAPSGIHASKGGGAGAGARGKRKKQKKAEQEKKKKKKKKTACQGRTVNALALNDHHEALSWICADLGDDEDEEPLDPSKPASQTSD